MKRSEYLKFF